jgi:hypothetical protein
VGASSLVSGAGPAAVDDLAGTQAVWLLTSCESASPAGESV